MRFCLLVFSISQFVKFYLFGAVAQLGERVNGIHEVEGSIPFSSTKTTFPGSAFLFRLISHRVVYYYTTED